MDIAKAIKKYGRKNLNTLDRKMMYLYTHDTLIPQMLEEMDPGFWYKQEEEQDTANVELLERYGPTKLCADTVGRWLKKIVFSYDIVSNKYYVDRHEKNDTIFYRHNIIDSYLLLKRRM